MSSRTWISLGFSGENKAGVRYVSGHLIEQIGRRGVAVRRLDICSARGTQPELLSVPGPGKRQPG